MLLSTAYFVAAIGVWTVQQGRIDDVMAHGHPHDVFVSVVGNSHFHLPFIEAVDTVDAVVLTHDTRLVELYLSLRDRGGLEQIMLRGKGRRALSPPIDEQIDDMRLLESTAFGTRMIIEAFEGAGVPVTET